MSAEAPKSLLITPDQRRRLQQRYEQALAMAAKPRPDFGHVHQLLAGCLAADPGNALYLNALLTNLRRRDATARSRSSWRRLVDWIASCWTRKSEHGEASRSEPTTQYSVLSTVPDVLWREFPNPAALRSFAETAAAHDFDEVELGYLFAARDAAPDDPLTLRMLARALTRQGQFEESLGPWFAVLAFVPEDAEAAQAIEDLRGASETVVLTPSDAPAGTPTNVAYLVRMAQSLQDSGAYSSAEQYLAQAQSAAGGDLAILELREDLRLRQSEQRLTVARRRASHDDHAKTQSLVAKFEHEHNRLHIEVLNIRAERLPQAVEIRIELARRLKQAGNFSGAIQRLEEALRLKPDEPATLIELGECWQHLRQFAKALGFYEQAIPTEDADSVISDNAKLAHYRAGVLAAAMGEIERARGHFEAIVTADPAFKDARQRLDNLG